MTQTLKLPRAELCILQSKNIDDFIELQTKYNIISVYIKVSLSNLSNTRQKLIDLDYTTRLFITYTDGKKEEYIYGKLKKHNGVFNEHCKNSVYRQEISNLVKISSNEDDMVIIDDINIQKEEKRKWILI